MLVDLDTEEFMNMTKELGITTWGQRRKLRKAIEELKNSMNEEIPKEPSAEYCEAEMEDGGNGDDIEETTLSQHEQTGPEEVPVNGEGPVPEDLEEEAAITDIEEDETSVIECPLCRDSSQHHCRKCGKLVCIPFCSIADPRSDNELHVVHKPNDIRCTGQSFECPNCGKTFASPTELRSTYDSTTHKKEACHCSVKQAVK